MSQGRHNLKILGLSLVAALGLMAVTTAAAQAGEFTLEGSTFTAKGLAQSGVAGPGEAGKLLVPGIGLTIACTDSEVISATVLLGGVAHASVLFLGCTVENSSVCHIYPTELDAEMGTNEGHIKAIGLGKLVLMSTVPVKHYLLVEENGAPLAFVYFKEGTGCNLWFENEITGNTVLELPTALELKVEQTLKTIPQAELEALFPADVLTFDGLRSWLDGGTAHVHLTGAQSGKTWGAE